MALTFAPIDIDQKDKYLECLGATPVKTSDCSFLNVWGWADEYKLQWALSDGLAWVRQELPAPAYWPPAGDWGAVSDWKAALQALGDPAPVFARVPEYLVEIWKEAFGERMESEPDRNQWDYLYRIDDLAELKGNRFHKKRNLLNQFLKKYDHTYICFGKQMIDKVMEMQSAWCEWRDCNISDALVAENRVIEKVLKAWEKLSNICGGAILVDDKVVAYTVAEALSKDTLLIHFEKGNASFTGTYQAINQMFASRAKEDERRNFELVNRMQDLGDKGLRKAKKSYNPVDFIRKYKVRISLS